MTHQTRTQSLIDEIDETLSLYDVSQAKFGAIVAGDPTLVWKMRVKGREPRPAMIEKIEMNLKGIRAGTWLKQNTRDS